MREKFFRFSKKIPCKMKTSRIVQIFEHEVFTFSRAGIEISESTIQDLYRVSERLKKEFGSEVFVLEFRGYRDFVGVRARQFAGIVRVNSELMLEFLPKMYNSGGKLSDKIASSIDNLFFMLEYCGDLVGFSKDKAGYNFEKTSIFETLIYIFATRLFTEIQKMPNCEYVSFDKNRRFLRGKMLVGENIRHNSLNKVRFYTRKDDFTIDNELNRIFKLATKKLISVTRNSKNRQILNQILIELSDVKSIDFNISKISKIKTNSLNSRFDESLSLAKLFLLNMSAFGAGGRDEFVILWEMNKLFERFISQILLLKSPKQTKIILQGGDRYLSEFPKKFKLRPDIIILENDNCKIIDTKYKILSGENGFLNVNQSDIYQVFAYAKKFNAKEAVLLYPQVENYEFGGEFIFDENSKLEIKTIDLNRKIRKEIVEIEREILKLL